MPPAPDNSANASRFRTGQLITGLVALAALGIALIYTFHFVFSRSMSLDEGYVMITVQGFNGGHALYDSVFTQYGPFYYFYKWLLHTVVAIPLTHDATRLLCVAHWLIASVILGAAAWRMTRSKMAALFVATLSVAHLSTIANEPGHPQELVVMLLALGTLAATNVRRWTFETLAVVAAALAFTKINVGAFFAFALFLAMRCHAADRFARGGWNWLLVALSAALPWLLVRQHLSVESWRDFSLVVTSATVAALVIARRERDVATSIAARSFPIAAAAFLLFSVVVISITLLTGTTWKGLLDGLILTPIKMPRFALLLIDLPRPALISAFASLAVVAFVLRRRHEPRVTTAVAVLKGAFAITGALILFGSAKNQLGYLLPWVWLIAVPGQNEMNRQAQFPRTFLCLAAAWQSLQAYPIAGTQVTLATFLFVLGYGVCLADALRALARLPQLNAILVRLTPSTRTLGHAFAGAALLFLFANAWCKLPQVRREYASLLPLNLPGSRLVRMNEEVTTMNQQLAQYLGSECDTFVSYPGINSLYFWSGKTPPTQINSTGWGQLTHAQQRKILGSLQQVRRPKLVVTEAMMKSWGTPYAEPIRPLVRYVTEECQPVKRIGRCLIFEPKPPAQLSATP